MEREVACVTGRELRRAGGSSHQEQACGGGTVEQKQRRADGKGKKGGLKREEVYIDTHTHLETEITQSLYF
jgi:hypothetical protein